MSGELDFLSGIFLCFSIGEKSKAATASIFTSSLAVSGRLNSL